MILQLMVLHVPWNSLAPHVTKGINVVVTLACGTFSPMADL